MYHLGPLLCGLLLAGGALLPPLGLMLKFIATSGLFPRSSSSFQN